MVTLTGVGRMAQAAQKGLIQALRHISLKKEHDRAAQLQTAASVQRYSFERAGWTPAVPTTRMQVGGPHAGGRPGRRAHSIREVS